MLSTFLLDVVFIFLNIGGIEYLGPADPAHPSGYGSVLIHAYYTLMQGIDLLLVIKNNELIGFVDQDSVNAATS